MNLSVYTYTRVGGHEQASAQASQTVNFQARLLSANGSIVPDGSYSVAFALYDQETGGSSQWGETQTVDVKAGYLSVYLGDQTAFPSSIDWSQQQWLTMNVDGDGEMTPRIRLTAVPYAFSAEIAGGLLSGNEVLEAGDFAQTAPLSVQDLNSSVAGLRINQTGSGGLLQLQGDGVDRFVVDKAGNVTMGGGLTLGDTNGTTTGTIRWDGSDFAGYDGNTWVSLTQGSGGGGGLEFTQGGNDFGEPAVLGTTSATDLEFITGNTTRLTISSTGSVSIADSLAVTNSVTASSFSGSGGGLTGLDASELATGTVDDARLSSNIARLDTQQTFAGLNTFTSGLVLGNNTSTTAGTLRWNGSDFEGFDGSEWISFTAGTGSAQLVLGMFSAYDSVGEVAIDAWTDLPLDTQERVDAEYTHTADTAPVTIEQDGWYEIDYRTSTYSNAGGNNQATVAARLQEDTGGGFSTIPGSAGSELIVSGGSDANMSNSVLREYTAGDIVKLQMQRSGGDAIAIATRPDSVSMTIRHISEAEAGGGSGTAFEQGGNSFGATAILGTTDTQALQFITDNTTALSINTAGEATFSQGLTIASGGLDVTGNSTLSGSLSGLSGLSIVSGGIDVNSSGISNAGSITGVGENITALNGLTLASGNANDLTLSAASGTLVVNADTWRRSAAGMTTLNLNDSGDTTFRIENSDGTGLADLSVEGEVSASSFAGAGSSLTDLDASALTSGELADGLLSNNVALLDQAQTFSGLTTLSSGLVVGNTSTTTTGAIRWSGVDFEGYTGSEWVSLTEGSGGGGPAPTLLEGVLAYGKVNGGGTAQSIDGATVVRNGAGDYTVTLDTAASSADYVVQLTVDEPDSGLDDVNISLANQTSSSFDVFTRVGDNGGSADVQTDKTWHFIAFDPDAEAGGGSNGGVYFEQGGNSFGATAILGTTDAQDLRFVTNGNTAFTLDAAGGADIANNLTVGGLLTADGNTEVSGGLVSIGTSTQSGGLSLSDGSNQSGLLQTSALSADRTYTLPDASGEICLSSGNCGNGGNFVEIGGNAPSGSLTLGTTNANAVEFITNNTVRVSVDTSGNVDLLTGGLQTLGVTRLTSSGALQNITGLTVVSGGADITGGISIAGGATISSGGINVTGDSTVDGTLTASSTLTVSAGGAVLSGGIDNNSGGITEAGALSGVSTIAASGNIDTSAGALQTNGTTRITNGGDLVNIGSITASGGVSAIGGFTANGQAGISGSCNGNNDYLVNFTLTGGIVTAGSCRQSGGLSDANLKENVVSLDSSILEGMREVNTVNFDFKCEEDSYSDLNLDCDRQTGVIAQELAEVFPELVYQGDDGYYRVRYDALNIYTLRAVSEVAKTVDSQQNISARDIKTDGTVRLSADGQLQNINGLSLVGGGASISGGINNNYGGLSNVGDVSGVAMLQGERIRLSTDADGGASPLVISKDDQDVFTVFDNGALELLADDQQAFRVADSDDNDIFTVDSQNGLVLIGDATPETQTVLFVLAGKHSQGDPTGAVNGAQYYNHAMERFRCYQEDRWQDCISGGISEHLLLANSVEGIVPPTETKLPGSSEVLIDTKSSYEARLQVESLAVNDAPETLQLGCEIEYRGTGPLGDNPWKQSGITVELTRESNLAVSDWVTLSTDLPEEAIVRIVCIDTAESQNEASPHEFMSVRLQLR